MVEGCSVEVLDPRISVLAANASGGVSLIFSVINNPSGSRLGSVSEREASLKNAEKANCRSSTYFNCCNVRKVLPSRRSEGAPKHPPMNPRETTDGLRSKYILRFE